MIDPILMEGFSKLREQGMMKIKGEGAGPKGSWHVLHLFPL